MKTRWLAPLALLLTVTTLVSAQAARREDTHGQVTPVGYLVAAAPASTLRPAPAVYEPRPGDIVLYDDFNKLFHFLFKLAKTDAPTHVAIVVARPDGTPALLDLTGPKTISAKVVILDVDTRLKSYPGVIMVRRIRQPLTPEQSQDLTRFAQTESGKSFALPRVMLQGTPFCPRVGLRRELFGKTYLTRDRWFCSELVVAACASARLLDPRAVRANATYPRDLAYDETINLSSLYHPPMWWTAAAPSILAPGRGR